ncbi:MAG: transposase [Pyrinomonadaceae bacterium]
MNEQRILERKQRGYDISQRYTIRQDGNFWFVPSSKSGKYKVDLKRQTCNCMDFETRKMKCKHLWAAEFHYEREVLKAIDDVPEAVKEVPKKRTYAQPNWSAYHKSQTCEKGQFLYLLRELTKGIESPTQKTGRTRHNFSDLIFSMCYKVYSCFSSRRFMTDLKTAFDTNYLERLPSYNSLIEAFSLEEITPLLHYLIEMSSLPLAAIEKDFCVDSTGLSTCRFYRWFHAKYTDKRLIDHRDWVKLHAMSGAKTNVITAVEISNRYEHDSNYFKPLVDKTALRFAIDEVSADKAYSSEKNMQTVLNHGAILFHRFQEKRDLWALLHGRDLEKLLSLLLAESREIPTALPQKK